MATRRGLGVGLGSGYYNLQRLDPYIHSLSRRGIKTRFKATELVFPRAFPANTKVVYHKGVFQNIVDKDHPAQDPKTTEAQFRRTNKIKDEIRNLLFNVVEYDGKNATEHKILEIVVLKQKEKHLNFLLSHTDWNTLGYFKDHKLKRGFDKEKNALVQVEYLDTKDGQVSKRLLALFDLLNQGEVGESLLYVRAEPVSDSSLGLRNWRLDKTRRAPQLVVEKSLPNGGKAVFAPEKVPEKEDKTKLVV